MQVLEPALTYTITYLLVKDSVTRFSATRRRLSSWVLEYVGGKKVAHNRASWHSLSLSIPINKDLIFQSNFLKYQLNFFRVELIVKLCTITK